MGKNRRIGPVPESSPARPRPAERAAEVPAGGTAGATGLGGARLDTGPGSRGLRRLPAGALSGRRRAGGGLEGGQAGGPVLSGLPAWTAAAAFLWLAGRVQPAGIPSPLILPLALATLTMIPPLGWLVVAAGTAGALSAGAWYGAAVLVTASLLVRLVQRTLERPRDGQSTGLADPAARLDEPAPPAGMRGPAAWRLVDGAAAGAVLLAGALWGWPRTTLGWAFDQLVGLGLAAATVGLTLPWAREAVAVALTLLPPLPGSLGRARAVPPVVRSVHGRRTLALAVVLATGGLDGVRFLGVDTALVVRGVAVLLAAHLGGAQAGALAGTAAGLLGLVGGQGSLWGLAWLSLAGASSGLLQRYGRAAGVAGFVFATAVVGGSLPTGAAVGQLAGGAVTALVLYAAIAATGWPGRLAQRLEAAWPAVVPGTGGFGTAAVAVPQGAGLRPRAPWGGGAGAGSDDPARAGQAPEDSAAPGLAGPEGAGPAAAGGRAPAPRPGCSAGTGDRPVQGAPGGAWATLLADLARLVEPDPGAWDPREQVGELINDVARRHCLRCPMARVCWQDQFNQTYQAFFDMLAAHERGTGFRPDAVPAPLRARCPRLPAISQSLAEGLDGLRLEMRWRRRLDRHHRLVAQQLRELAALAAQGVPRPAGPRRPGWRYGMRVGVARTPKDGRWISGDGYLCRSFDQGGRMVLVISDGMGSGRRAANESRLALQVLERLLEAGLPAASAVRLLNTALALRDRETYTTVDLAAVDLERGRVEFVKIGAAPSFVRRAREVRMIAHPVPPAGYAEGGDVQADGGVLEPGDLVVLVSDGVLTAFGDVDGATAWIRGYLAGLEDDDPRRVAAQIVKEALRRAGDRAPDDMTVVTGKLLPRAQLAPLAGAGGLR